MDTVYQFIFENGSGNVSADLAMLGLGLVVVMQGFFLSVLSRKVHDLDSFISKFEKSSQAGKLQKLEDNINSFRTEVLRALSTASKAEKTSSEEKQDSEFVSVADSPVSENSSFAASDSQNAQQAAVVDQSGIETQQQIAADNIAKPEHVQKKSIFDGLAKTRSSLLDKIRNVFTGSPQLSADSVEELEAQLVGADLGIALSSKLLDELKTDLKSGKSIDQSELVDILKNKVEKILLNGALAEPAVEPSQTEVILMVGVNGAGKTTTSAKLAHNYKSKGKKVLLVAADTFRAAAVDQLQVWADRLGIAVVAGAENAKPSTVVFEAMERAKNEAFDVVIIDTAGRLQNKNNLMQELTGVKNAISRHMPGQPQEVLLVVDGASGQNAISQAREFKEAAAITGVVVTKLDGTPKGGSVVAIKSELGISVKFIGIGEGLEDLRAFDAREFTAGLFG